MNDSIDRLGKIGRTEEDELVGELFVGEIEPGFGRGRNRNFDIGVVAFELGQQRTEQVCLLYTSPIPRDATLSRMPSSA